LVPLVNAAFDEQEVALATLYILSYWYLLRVPSEGLPACLGSVGVESRQRAGKQLVLEGDKATWYFDRRKNREFPTRAGRPHTCRTGAKLCPVCTLESFIGVQGLAAGDALFPGISAKQFNCQLRKHMAASGAPSAETFTSKGFRRGHAQDISRRYGISPELKASGGWTSIAGALCYASREELEDLFVTKEARRKKKPRQASSDSSSSSSDD
jgi:hypothetical protein